MSLDIPQVASESIPILVASLATYWFGRHQERHGLRRRRREAVVGDLVPAIRRLQGLANAHGYLATSPAEAVAAFSAWYDAFNDHRTRLPGKWRHLNRSVRAACGTVFGAVAFIDIRPDVVGEPLGDPDAEWQQNAVDYLDHALDELARWADSDTGSAGTILDYDAWLARRRELVGI